MNELTKAVMDSKPIDATLLAELAIETKSEEVVKSAVDVLLELDSGKELLFDVMCRVDAFWYRLSDVIGRYGQEFLDRVKPVIEEEEHPVKKATMLTYLAGVAWKIPVAMDALSSLLDNMSDYKFSAILSLVNSRRNRDITLPSTMRYLEDTRNYIDDLDILDDKYQEIAKGSSGTGILCTTLLYLEEKRMGMTTVEEIVINALLDEQKVMAYQLSKEWRQTITSNYETLWWKK